MSLIFINDEILINELKSGNKKAFTFLFKEHYENLCNYIFSLTKNYKQAEDISQNTMFYIWENRVTLNSSKSVKSFIYKIAYHQFINEYRKNKQKLDYFDEIKKLTLTSYFEEESIEPSNKHAIILGEIENLSPKCKEAFLLHKKHGLKYKEVAEELNISIKTVEIHISKALRIIKNKLDEIHPL